MQGPIATLITLILRSGQSDDRLEGRFQSLDCRLRSGTRCEVAALSVLRGLAGQELGGSGCAFVSNSLLKSVGEQKIFPRDFKPQAARFAVWWSRLTTIFGDLR